MGRRGDGSQIIPNKYCVSSEFNQMQVFKLCVYEHFYFIELNLQESRQFIYTDSSESYVFVGGWISIFVETKQQWAVLSCPCESFSTY